jgi:flagellar hook-associated protein 2
MTKSLDDLGKQYDATSERIDATSARCKAQFTQLDVLISSMNQTSSYLTRQFDAMNNTSK